MKIIKRNGVEVIFDIKKIITAISKANKEVPQNEQLSESEIFEIAKTIIVFLKLTTFPFPSK